MYEILTKVDINQIPPVPTVDLDRQLIWIRVWCGSPRPPQNCVVALVVAAGRAAGFSRLILVGAKKSSTLQSATHSEQPSRNWTASVMLAGQN